MTHLEEFLDTITDRYQASVLAGAKGDNFLGLEGNTSKMIFQLGDLSLTIGRHEANASLCTGALQFDRGTISIEKDIRSELENVGHTPAHVAVVCMQALARKVRRDIVKRTLRS